MIQINNFIVSLMDYDETFRLRNKDNKSPYDYIGDFYMNDLINKINQLNGDLK